MDMNSVNDSGDNSVLRTEGLSTYFHLDEGVLKAVDNVDFNVQKGEVVAILGESGCGKSVLAQSLLQLVPDPGRVSGDVYLRPREGDEIRVLNHKKHSKQMRRIRGGEISMIFQETMSALSPVHTVRSQISETIRLHRPELSDSEVEERAVESLGHVGIPQPRRMMDNYAFQLSGGLRQRVMIGMALSTHPTLLIADEPTTALDVTTQAQILKLLVDLQKEMGMSIIYITHSLAVASNIADRALIMYLGKIVEEGEITQIFNEPKHPYTRGLLKAVPKISDEGQTTLETIDGTVPVPLEMPEQCGFCSRCPHAMKGKCDKKVPPFYTIDESHKVRCFLYE